MSVSDIDRQQDRQAWWSIHDPDEYVCPDCRRTRDEHRRIWEVHHVDRKPGQIVGLCRSCHRIRHGAKPERIDLQFWKESIERFDI